MEIVYDRKPRQKVNRLADIVYKIGFVGADGAAISIPGYPWEITFFTDSRHAVVCSNKERTLRNCYSDGQFIYCNIPGGTFPEGVLRIKTVLSVPDSHFPDGSRDVAKTIETIYAFADPQKAKDIDEFFSEVVAINIDMSLVSEDGLRIITEDGQPIDLSLDY